jgi:carboxyl-terminal processing protease
VRSFSISDEDYADFCAFIAQRDVPYESETRRALAALERAVDNDLYDEALGGAVEQLKGLIKDDKMSNMETYKAEIMDALNADIVMRYAYSEGVAERAAANDEMVQRAVELLQDEAEYRRILEEQHLDRR